MTPEFTKERDALRVTNRQLAEANAALTARVAEFDAVCESLHQTRAEAAGLETDLKEARTLNAQLAAQVDDARRQRDECAARSAELEANATVLSRYRDDREAYWVKERSKWIAEHDLYAASCKWHAERAEKAEAAAVDWRFLAEARRESLAEVEETCDELVARLAEQSPEPTPLEAAVTTHAEADCRGDCLTAADVGVSLPGNPIAYAHPDCALHNGTSTTHTEAIAVTVERSTTQPDVLIARTVDDQIAVATDEAVALIAALLADGRVHSAWLHGRGGR